MGAALSSGHSRVCVQMMVLVMVSSRTSYPTSQPGTACEIQQLLGSDEEKLSVELGAPCPQAAALGFFREFAMKTAVKRGS